MRNEDANEKLRILQINVDRGRAASLLAEKTFLDFFDIALVQEPYRKHVGKGNYTIFRKEGREQIKAEIWVKSDIKAKRIDNLTTTNIVTVKIEGRKELFVTTWYDEPGGTVNRRLREIDTMISEGLKRHVMGGDANAHNGAWGFDEDDARGEELLEWAVMKGYLIVNDKYQGPTFRTTRGQSSVDLTMAKGIDVGEWNIMEEETLSGHRYLAYYVWTGTERVKPRMIYDFGNTNWNNFRHKLAQKHDAVDWENKETEQKAEELQRICRSTCIKHIKRNEVPSNAKSWWTEELKRLRAGLRRKRAKWQMTRRQEEKNAYIDYRNI